VRADVRSEGGGRPSARLRFAAELTTTKEKGKEKIIVLGFLFGPYGPFFSLRNIGPCDLDFGYGTGILTKNLKYIKHFLLLSYACLCMIHMYLQYIWLGYIRVFM